MNKLKLFDNNSFGFNIWSTNFFYVKLYETKIDRLLKDEKDKKN